MALRAALNAQHTRSLVFGLARRQPSPLSWITSRPFSRSPLLYVSGPNSTPEPYPVDPLLADVLSTNEKLESSPKRKLKEETTSSLGEAYGADLPPVEEWPKLFPWALDLKARSTVYNPDTAALLAETFVPEGSKGKVILEAYPGPGALSRALLNLPKERISRLIILEDNKSFLKFLTPLEKLDSRVTVLPHGGFYWHAYEQLDLLHLLDDIPITDWSSENPKLQFISHIPATVHGEQLVSQFLRSIPCQQWLFKYGRFPLDFVMPNFLWQRISATPNDIKTRCKLSVIAEATVSYRHAIPAEALAPYKSHFYPTKGGDHHFIAVNMRPLQNQLIDKAILDEWDYCLRRMFVLKATALKSNISSLGPGATSLLKKVTSEELPPDQRLNPKAQSRHMTALQWKTLVDTFADWPFKPEDLSIDNYHSVTNKRRNTKTSI